MVNRKDNKIVYLGHFTQIMNKIKRITIWTN